MSERLMDVNAYTTFGFVEATVYGHGWKDEAVGALDVTTDEEGNVVLEHEFDDTCLELPQHAVRFEMSPEEARTLAESIEEGLGSLKDTD